MIRTYLPGMFVRIAAMLAILSITVVTTVTSAHAARMSAVADHAVHASEMIHVQRDSDLSCGGDQHCGSVDAGVCDVVCAGLSVFLPSPSGEAGRDFRPDGHNLPSGFDLTGEAPGLNERPPKLRLL